MRTTFAALRIRNYRLFATGSLVSNIGTWMQRVAQDWLILALTGSAGALGITTGLQFLPIVLVSPIAGVIADRYSKRSVLMVTQLAMAATAAILGLLAITGVINHGTSTCWRSRSAPERHSTRPPARRSSTRWSDPRSWRTP